MYFFKKIPYCNATLRKTAYICIRKAIMQHRIVSAGAGTPEHAHPEQAKRSRYIGAGTPEQAKRSRYIGAGIREQAHLGWHIGVGTPGAGKKELSQRGRGGAGIRKSEAILYVII